MKILTTNRGGRAQRFLLRGDSEGYVTLWNVPDITIEEVKQIQDSNAIKSKSRAFSSTLFRRNNSRFNPTDLTQTVCTSLSDAWNLMNPHPVGILDQLNEPSEPSIKLTASIYLPQQSRLVVGRQDGTIIIVPATQTVMMQLLHVLAQNVKGSYRCENNRFEFISFNRIFCSEWPAHQVLSGHRGRVNCLLCPSLANPR